MDRRAAPRHDRDLALRADGRARHESCAHRAAARDRRRSRGARARLSVRARPAPPRRGGRGRRGGDRRRHGHVAAVSTIGVVTALRLETRAVLGALTRTRRLRPAARPSWSGRAGEHEIVVVEGGVGPVAAARAAMALPARITLVGSLGFAGGLDPELATGDVIVPSAIVWEEGGLACRHDVEPALVDRLARVLTPVLARPPRIGTLFSAAAVVADVAAKRAAYERHAAAGVEMEAAALAQHAREHGVPLFALRVVLDPAALSLEQLPGDDAVGVAAARDAAPSRADGGNRADAGRACGTARVARRHTRRRDRSVMACIRDARSRARRARPIDAARDRACPACPIRNGPI
ncbi:MAG: hypothetical protein E6J72_00620 [Deltaproteobacteria bacterium]|nr:MAG: hypothetical protein E6J72_00620 [Deltaproteobacteria bacterium]